MVLYASGFYIALMVGVYDPLAYKITICKIHPLIAYKTQEYIRPQSLVYAINEWVL